MADPLDIPTMRVVFFGDSLTEGTNGASYLRLLAERVRAEQALAAVELVNAGVGGDTVVNLLRRMKRAVVAQAPDWVVVFIGCNDCMTWQVRRSLLPAGIASRRYFRRHKDVREALSPVRFRDGLRMLVDALRERLAARIALCTPATIGESLTARPWRRLDRYAEVVRFVAAERGCDLIDVHAAFAEALASLPPRPRLAPLRGLRARALPPGDYEAVARARGYRLVYDGLHLTHAGADLVAATMFAWLRRAADGARSDVVACSSIIEPDSTAG
ncbi:MAG TPA: GDSL-type esterase/lipase family protein [Ktedonobacterales bacterium]|nr:GDSL-type esterase/lipase family protein [Ktedonobacterales bacterium]